ncbi:MAG: NusG domain II-containing protein [Clostridia bacterium]|nr:NusG domain II-containing protein [Clostridia bacterium]
MNRVIADPSKRSDKKGRLKSGDLFIVCLVLLAAVVLFLLGLRGETAAHVEVSINAAQTEVFPLAKDGSYLIDGHLTVVIESGSVRIEDADCPDRFCVRTGAIRSPGQMLVCLPNQIVVRIVGTGETEVDAVVY